MTRQKTISVRITQGRYSYLRKRAKENGQSISWLLNLAIDLMYQDDPSYLRHAPRRQKEATHAD